MNSYCSTDAGRDNVDDNDEQCSHSTNSTDWKLLPTKLKIQIMVLIITMCGQSVL